MNCPKCGHEPRHRLLSSPCPNPECKYVWWDTEDFVRMLAKGLEVDAVCDIGCGQKGVIAQAYWAERRIKRGYACDRHTLKLLPPPWSLMLCDAEELHERGVRVDFLTHCGLLEHIDAWKALRILRVIEKITTKRVFFTCSALLREVDYKSKRDGNPFHLYKSWWSAEVFEALGYTVDRERMKKRLTFVEEVTGWFDPPTLPQTEDRWHAAVDVLCRRECQLCDGVPVFWDATQDGDMYYCLDHAIERLKERGNDEAPLVRWRQHPKLQEVLATIPCKTNVKNLARWQKYGR